MEIVNWAHWRIVWLRSGAEPKIKALLSEKKADGVGISPHSGFEGSDLTILRDLPLKGVVLPYASQYDISILREKKELWFLAIAGNRQKFDFNVFANLKELRLEWHNKFRLPDANRTL